MEQQIFDSGFAILDLTAVGDACIFASRSSRTRLLLQKYGEMEADKDLVYRTLKRDSDAFGSLVEMYRDEVYAIALSIAGDPTDAEDLTQEAFIKAYLNLSQLEHPDAHEGGIDA